MLAISQLIILMLIANGAATMRAQAEELQATLDRIDEVKALECAAYNILFDLCLHLREEAPALANDSVDLEAAVAEWEAAIESGMAGWQSIREVEVELINIKMGDYDGRALDAVQMRVAGDERSGRYFSGELSITIFGNCVNSQAHFTISFSA